MRFMLDTNICIEIIRRRTPVLLTSNGKPMAVMLNVNADENPEPSLTFATG